MPIGDLIYGAVSKYARIWHIGLCNTTAIRKRLYAHWQNSWAKLKPRKGLILQFYWKPVLCMISWAAGSVKTTQQDDKCSRLCEVVFWCSLDLGREFLSCIFLVLNSSKKLWSVSCVREICGGNISFCIFLHWVRIRLDIGFFQLLQGFTD